MNSQCGRQHSKHSKKPFTERTLRHHQRDCKLCEEILRATDFGAYLEYLSNDIIEIWARIHENMKLMENGGILI